MKIITLSPTNKREKPTTKSKVIEVLPSGVVLDSAGLKNGENIMGNDKWHELTVGGYLWSGNVKEYVKTDPVKYSQTDWRWSWRTLGWGGWGQTIGNYGCALTSCSMLCGIDPSTLNEYLKRVGGYVQQTLLVWGALEKATSGKLKYVSGVGIPYDNAKCLEIIKREKGCVVQVYGSGIPMHFVVAIGNGQIIDPLDGKIKPFSTYYAVELRDIVRI